MYAAILAPMNGFAETLNHFQAIGGKGLNVTLPFKQEAFTVMDHLSQRASLAKAVNTILINPDGSRYGDNTDGIGLIRDLVKNIKIHLHDKRILILGAGGAISGIIGPLLAEKPQEIIVANRTLDKALHLIDSFKHLGVLKACPLSDLQHESCIESHLSCRPSHDLSFDIVINGISAGLHGEMPVLNPCLINKNTFCYDLLYGKDITPFLRWAKEQGAMHMSDGLGMLVEQAAEAFYVWRDIMPDTQSVIAKLRS